MSSGGRPIFFKDHGEALYAWLIEPIKPLLEKSGVDTLVFVPDGALRSVPIAALYDGQKYVLCLLYTSPSPRDRG